MPDETLEQIAKMIAWDEYGDLADSWADAHSCGALRYGCCGGGKDVDREVLTRIVLSALREAEARGRQQGQPGASEPPPGGCV